MALKIQENNSAVAYHVVDGAVVFPYAIDAQQAVGRHPDEWRADPWSPEEAEVARKKLGLTVPEVTPEEQAAIDEHNKAVAEAKARLDAFRAKKAEEKAIADQIAADEALIATPAPMPDPTARRGPGRPKKAE